MACHTQLMLPRLEQSCYYRVHENEMNKREMPLAVERERELFNLRGASLPHDFFEIQYTGTPALAPSTSDNLLSLSPPFPPHIHFFLYVL